jgi:hypothetical protein
MKRISAIILLIFLCYFGYGQQEVLYLDGIDPVYSITFPTDWKVDKKDGRIKVNPPQDTTIHYWLWELKKKDMNTATKGVDTLLKRFVSKAKMGLPAKSKKKFVEITEIKGTATRNLKNVDVYTGFFKAKDRLFGVVYYGEPANLQKWATKIEEIQNSIKSR